MEHRPKHHTLYCNTHSQGHNMHYLHWGETALEDAHTILICVHGFTHNARYFDALAQAVLQQHPNTVLLCPDIVGRGRSDWLEDPQYYQYPTYVNDIDQLVECCPPKARIILLGTSMGGLIHMMLCAANPVRFSGLILNDLGMFIPGFSLNRIGAFVGQNMRHATRHHAMASLQTELAQCNITDPAQWERLFFHHFHKNEAGEYVAHYDPAIGAAFWNKRGKQRRMYDMDFRQLWQGITCPTLILRGEYSDILLQDTAREMVRRPNTTLVEIAQTGHVPLLQNTAQQAAILNWLSDHAEA